jgi:hypothetical protein
MKRILLAALVAACFSAVPTLAIASGPGWTENGNAIEEDKHVLLEGTTKFESATLGSTDCAKTTATVNLTATTLDGHVASYGADELGSCAVSGFLGSTCGTKSLTGLHLATGNAPKVKGTLGSKQFDISGLDLVYEYGSPCLTLHLTGSLLAALDSETAIKTATLSGQLETNGFGKVKISSGSTLTATPEGVFGLN